MIVESLPRGEVRRPAEVRAAELRAAPAVPAVGTADPGAFWSAVRAAAGVSRQMEALVDAMRLVSLEGDVAVVEASEALAPRVQSRTPEIEQMFARAAGKAVKLRVRAGQGAVSQSAEGGAQTPQTPRTPPGEHPLVKRTLAALGGRIAGVTARPRELDDPEKAAP